MADRFLKVVCGTGHYQYFAAVYDSEKDRYALFSERLDDPLTDSVAAMNNDDEEWAWEEADKITFVALPVKENNNDY